MAGGWTDREHPIQDAVSILNVVVLAVGYYFLIRLYREWIRQSKEERIAGGRPMAVVAADYSHLPEVGLVVRNFTKAPARDVAFEFSAPVENSSGQVLSALPYFENGLPFLEPEGLITCRWDSLSSLVSLFKEKGLKDGIRVRTRYKDSPGESYESEWTLAPHLFEGAPMEASLGMNDLVSAVEKIPAGAERDGRQGSASSGENRGGERVGRDRES